MTTVVILAVAVALLATLVMCIDVRDRRERDQLLRMLQRKVREEQEDREGDMKAVNHRITLLSARMDDLACTGGDDTLPSSFRSFGDGSTN